MLKKIALISLLILLLINTVFPYNPEHVKVFLTVNPYDYWDQWRKKNPRIKPDLSNAELQSVRFDGDFSHANLRNIKVNGFDLVKADFFYTDLSYSKFKNMKVIVAYGSRERTYPIFKHANLFRSEFLNCEISYSKFYYVNFSEAVIKNTKINYAEFNNINFHKVKIINSVLGSEFFSVDFSNSIISKTVFITNNIKKMINIKFNNAELIQCDFQADVISSNFSNAILKNSNLSYIPLTNVNFTNANLTNVNFHKSKFNNVIFKNADMTGVKLERKWYDYVKKQGVRNFDKIRWQ